ALTDTFVDGPLREGAVGEGGKKSGSKRQIGGFRRGGGCDGRARQPADRGCVSIRDRSRENTACDRIGRTIEGKAARIDDRNRAVCAAAVRSVREPWTPEAVVERNAEWKAHGRQGVRHPVRVFDAVDEQGTLSRVKNDSAACCARLSTAAREGGRNGHRVFCAAADVDREDRTRRLEWSCERRPEVRAARDEQSSS